jgi:hypothetical protein
MTCQLPHCTAEQTHGLGSTVVPLTAAKLQRSQDAAVRRCTADRHASPMGLCPVGVLQVDNASLMGAMKLACSEMGLQPVEPFLDKVR